MASTDEFCYHIGVVLLVPMLLGVAVMLTGGGVVLYARSLANAPRRVPQRDRTDTDSVDAEDPSSPTGGLFGDPGSTRWWGVGTIIVGAFLVIASGFFSAAR